ncbi:DUF3373 family protein [Sulfurimonas sp.]
MNKPLLLSLAAAALLGTNLNAQSMYERIQSMELQMKQMKAELDTLKAQKVETIQVPVDKKEAMSDDEADENDDEELANNTSEESDDDGETIEEKIADLQESIFELNKATNGSHLKFNADYRYTLENINYKMADGTEYTNDAFMTNRVWLNMNWAATKNISFTAQLAYNSSFGQRIDNDLAGYNFENFDWVASENPYDDVVRVRSAYLFYKNDTFLTADIPWTFSIGRRPSTNGHLINLRDDDTASSPMAHTINVEFDGLSAKFNLENLTGADGMYLKFCVGRGLSNAAHKFTAIPYATEDNLNNNIDMGGFVFVPYSDGQYSIGTMYTYANNLIDQKFLPTGGVLVPQNEFYTVGGLHAATVNFTANGIGDGISDFLDDTVFFISGAASLTNPDTEYTHYNPITGVAYQAKGMLGSSKAKAGYSYWVGLQIPSLISEDGKWGFEYNHGTKYWRSITYAEDTNIGSKVATRGDAYEAYFTEYLVDEILSMQIRYTYIDYKYSGSNGFFGDTTGYSMSMEEALAAGMGGVVVDKAQDIRFYLRYRY